MSDRDVSAVLVIRHAAVPMVMNDTLWADGFLAEGTELKDPVTGEPTKRNPFVNIPAGAQHALTWPDGALDTLIQRLLAHPEAAAAGPRLLDANGRVELSFGTMISRLSGVRRMVANICTCSTPPATPPASM